MLLSREMGLKLIDRPATGGVNARWDNLVAGWKLDEESDGSGAVSRADVLGTYTLTDNNTTASAAGIIGNSADFVAASSEYLNITDSAFDFGDTDFTYVTWVSRADIPATAYVLMSTNPLAGSHGLYLRLTSGTTFEFWYRNFNASVATNVSSAGWNMVTIWHDATANQIGIALNDAASVTAADGVADTGATALELGRYASGQYLNGALDESYFFSTAIGSDADWRAGMYNSGAGRSYPN